jgi:precorrin-2/cobalt-factor-2 C20-methyltransferase
MTNNLCGVFYGAGVGPGDPELITLKTLRILQECPVIAVPKANDESSSVALGIAKKALRLDGKEILELSLPMTKNAAELAIAREKAADEIAKRLKQNLDVVFITLGDPMLYSTFSYFVPLLKEKLPSLKVSVSAGVTSFSSATAALLLPLAEADERVAIIPASYGQEDIERTLDGFDTIIFMKVHKTMDFLVDLLCARGLDKNAYLISKAGWDSEEIETDIRKLKGVKHGYFSMLIVKK